MRLLRRLLQLGITFQLINIRHYWPIFGPSESLLGLVPKQQQRFNPAVVSVDVVTEAKSNGRVLGTEIF